MKVEISALREHPLNKKIYSTDEKQLDELVERIRTSNWIKPLIVVKEDEHYKILSGHRRFHAAQRLNINDIEIEVFTGDEDAQLEQILLENAYREKSTTEKVREAEIIHSIESKKAELRKLSGVDQRASVPQGRTNEIVGEKIGMSPRSYHESRKVVQKIDETEDPIQKFFFEETLDNNIQAASILVSKPQEFVQKVIEKTDDIKKVGSVIRELENEEKRKKFRLPEGKHRVIYVDLCGKYSTDISTIPIADITDTDCTLYIWAVPHKVADVINIATAWGFKYYSCLVKCKYIYSEVTDDVDVLLVFTKGQPYMFIKQLEDIEVSEKPLAIRERIKSMTDSKIVELQFEGSFQSWSYWGTVLY